MGVNDNNNYEKTEDYGTFFYKLRNGSLPFEYDISRSVEKINKTIAGNRNDLIIGVISAVLAELINTKIFKLEIGIVFYLELILLIFLSFKLIVILISLVKFIKEKIWPSEELISAPEVQDLFYRKILVQTTHVFSVVKRIQELEERENCTPGDDPDNFSSKKDLIKVYSMQGLYGIKKITSELSDLLIIRSKAKKEMHINAIGKENLKKVICMLDKCLKYIKKSNINCEKECLTIKDENYKTEDSLIKCKSEKCESEKVECILFEKCEYKDEYNIEESKIKYMLQSLD